MNTETDQAILEARKKFGELYGNTKIGGKGSQKKKKLVKHRETSAFDKKIQSLAKKANSKKLTDTMELNIFKDDNSVLHFKKPTVEYSVKEKCTFVTGTFETKTIKDLLPNIIKQLGPKQFSVMKDYAEELKKTDDKKIDEAPELVEDFEEVSKK
jgi:nascent polypeptide-associated complex subunit beta